MLETLNFTTCLARVSEFSFLATELIPSWSDKHGDSEAQLHVASTNRLDHYKSISLADSKRVYCVYRDEISFASLLLNSTYTPPPPPHGLPPDTPVPSSHIPLQ